MSKWIDAEWLTDAVEGTDWYHINKDGELVSGARSDEDALYKADDVYKVVDEAPSIDLVRCRECKHYFSDGGAMMFCENTDFPTNADDFCSYGERASYRQVTGKLTEQEADECKGCIYDGDKNVMACVNCKGKQTDCPWK